MRKKARVGFTAMREVAKSIEKQVNIFAVILEFGLPKATKGSDYCCILRLIDDTHHTIAISANIFAAKVEELPRVAAAGDIIQLANVMVKTYGNEPTLVFYKWLSSFALYKGKDGGDDFAPYQVSSKFHPREEDKIFLKNLRKWLVGFQLQEDLNGFSMLSEIQGKIHINLACKILHHFEVGKDKLFVFVWDGTDTPPNAIDSKLEYESNSPLPLQLEPLPLEREILCSWPTIGSIMRIGFEQSMKNDYLQLLKANEWIKFMNIRLEVHGGLWYGAFTSMSKFRYTRSEDSLIVQRQRLADERISSLKSGRMLSYLIPSPLGITVVNHEWVTPVTLMHILTHSEVTAKFKCIVRVVAALPYEAENLCSPEGKYRMRLTLEDPTARIHAFVVAEDGEKFFYGHPDKEVLTRKLNRILGREENNDTPIWLKKTEPPRNPPRVSVCIMSFYTSDSDVWGTRQFRVFDTKLVEEV